MFLTLAPVRISISEKMLDNKIWFVRKIPICKLVCADADGDDGLVEEIFDDEEEEEVVEPQTNTSQQQQVSML